MATLHTNARDAALTAINNLINQGSGNAQMRIYTAGGSASGTLLATLNLNSTSAFGQPNNGAMSTNTVSSDTSADATGIAAVAEIYNKNGTLVISNISVGTAGTEIIFPSVNFQQGDTISISSFTLTHPAT